MQLLTLRVVNGSLNEKISGRVKTLQLNVHPTHSAARFITLLLGFANYRMSHPTRISSIITVLLTISFQQFSPLFFTAILFPRVKKRAVLENKPSSAFL